MKKAFIISLIIFLIDRITKQLAISNLVSGKSITIIKNFFSLTLAKNTGVAFSLLEGSSLLIIIITIIIILLLLKNIKNNNSNKEIILDAIIIGGAIGNLLDRLIYGYVIDFLDFNILGYNYPIFNIADTVIVVGIFLIIVTNMKEKGGL